MRTIFTLLVGVVAMVCTGCEVDDTELKNSKTYTLYEAANLNYFQAQLNTHV